MTAILLDSGPLGLLSHPGRHSTVVACHKWAADLLAANRRVIVPEIADYEVRQELLRVNRIAGLGLLDALAVRLEYLPLTTAAMRKAAELWAAARQAGQPTAGDNTIDADVILAAQALTLGVPVVIATANVHHLARFVQAELWTNIVP